MNSLPGEKQYVSYCLCTGLLTPTMCHYIMLPILTVVLACGQTNSTGGGRWSCCPICVFLGNEAPQKSVSVCNYSGRGVMAVTVMRRRTKTASLWLKTYYNRLMTDAAEWCHLWCQTLWGTWQTLTLPVCGATVSYTPHVLPHLHSGPSSSSSVCLSSPLLHPCLLKVGLLLSDKPTVPQSRVWPGGLLHRLFSVCLLHFQSFNTVLCVSQKSSHPTVSPEDGKSLLGPSSRVLFLKAWGSWIM